MQKRLLDDLFKKYPDLKEIKKGQGNKRYIYKKENEDIILSKIKAINKGSITKSDTISSIAEIDNYLFKNCSNQTYTLTKMSDLFSREFNIKRRSRVISILRQLQREGKLEAHFGNYTINRRVNNGF